MDELVDATWNFEVDSRSADLLYSLSDYWADRGKQEKLISGSLPDGANWTTHVVLTKYRKHFPWEWIQGRFGIGEEEGFAEVAIAVAATIILLMGLSTFCALFYLLCCTWNHVIKRSDLEKHQQHWKWLFGAVVVAGSTVTLVSSLLFLQSGGPVIRSGIDTFSRVSTFILEDLQIYRQRISLENDYFFDTYLRENFVTLYDIKYVIGLMKHQLQLESFSDVQERLVDSTYESALKLTSLRASIFNLLTSTTFTVEGMTNATQAIEEQLTRLREMCTNSPSSVSCVPSSEDSIDIVLPQMGVLTDQLNRIDEKFLTVNWTVAKHTVRKVASYFTMMLKTQGSLADALETIGQTIESVATSVYKDQYNLDEGLPLSLEFAEGPLEFWELVQQAEKKYGTPVYIGFVILAVAPAIAASLILVAFLFAVLGTRESKFPCYQRSSTATTSASFLLQLNNVTLAVIIPLTVLAALALIGGTLATILAESINSKAIFDKIIDITPRISHTFVINDQIIYTGTYKQALLYCERADIGILYALNATLPALNNPIDTSVLEVSDTTHLSSVFSTLSAYIRDLDWVQTMSSFIATDTPSLISLSTFLDHKGDDSLYHSKSLYFANISQYYGQQQNKQSDSSIVSNLQGLSSGYMDISNQLLALDTQLKSLVPNLEAIRTDVSSMIVHYMAINATSREILDNVASLQDVFKDKSNLEQLNQLALDRLMVVDEVFVGRSLAVLKSNLGRCGHLAYIYSVVSELCFFTTTRYANIIWFTLVILSFAMALTAFACAVVYRYFGEYEGIDYTTEDEKIKLSTKESTLPLTDNDQPTGRRIRNTLANIFGSSKAQSHRSRGKKLTATKTVEITSSVVSSDSFESLPTLYKSEPDENVDLLSLRDLARVSLSFSFSDLSSPLVQPSAGEPITKPIASQKSKPSEKKSESKRKIEKGQRSKHKYETLSNASNAELESNGTQATRWPKESKHAGEGVSQTSLGRLPSQKSTNIANDASKHKTESSTASLHPFSAANLKVSSTKTVSQASKWKGSKNNFASTVSEMGSGKVVKSNKSMTSKSSVKSSKNIKSNKSVSKNKKVNSNKNAAVSQLQNISEDEFLLGTSSKTVNDDSFGPATLSGKKWRKSSLVEKEEGQPEMLNETNIVRNGSADEDEILNAAFHTAMSSVEGSKYHSMLSQTIHEHSNESSTESIDDKLDSKLFISDGSFNRAESYQQNLPVAKDSNAPESLISLRDSLPALATGYGKESFNFSNTSQDVKEDDSGSLK